MPDRSDEIHAPECSVDGCRQEPLIGETINYWGVETWIYLCAQHMIQKRHAGLERDEEGNVVL